MQHPTLRLVRPLLVGVVLLLAPASVASGQTLQPGGNMLRARGGDGVGGIEKTGGNKPPSPTTPTGSASAPSTSVVEPSAWTDLGGGLAGTGGMPELVGTGDGTPGTPITLAVQEAAPWAPVTLVVGTQPMPLPFKGGTLVPVPQLIVGGLATDGTGGLKLGATLPELLPPGLTLCVQLWLFDPQGPQGLSATNALLLQMP